MEHAHSYSNSWDGRIHLNLVAICLTGSMHFLTPTVGGDWIHLNQVAIRLTGAYPCLLQQLGWPDSSQPSGNPLNREQALAYSNSWGWQNSAQPSGNTLNREHVYCLLQQLEVARFAST